MQSEATALSQGKDNGALDYIVVEIPSVILG